MKTYLHDVDRTAAHVASSRGAGSDDPAPLPPLSLANTMSRSANRSGSVSDESFDVSWTCSLPSAFMIQISAVLGRPTVCRVVVILRFSIPVGCRA